MFREMAERQLQDQISSVTKTAWSHNNQTRLSLRSVSAAVKLQALQLIDVKAPGFDSQTAWIILIDFWCGNPHQQKPLTQIVKGYEKRTLAYLFGQKFAEFSFSAEEKHQKLLAWKRSTNVGNPALPDNIWQ